MQFVTSTFRERHLAVCVGEDCPFFSYFFNSSSGLLHLIIYLFYFWSSAPQGVCNPQDIEHVQLHLTLYCNTLQ